ncbi:MAG: hypothetical protein A2Z31_02575 [candidate division NC10 bacterium RBG_16_65_8]|nr:MAG: hypothetical protein A2Z31_02575 [candidate division NC10 bacterium RBG_16_65_8]
MSEIKGPNLSLSNQPEKGKEPTAPNWRNTLLGVGMFLIIIALFVGAATKEAGGVAPKLILTLGFGVMAVSIVATIVNSIKSKMNGGHDKRVVDSRS